MTGEEGFDGRFQVRDAFEGRAADGFLAQFSKPAFDQISPGGAGRSKVQMEARMFFQPPLHFGVLVGAIVIENEMEGEFLGITRLQGAQKLQELLGAVTRQALADDFALQPFEGGKQGLLAHPPASLFPSAASVVPWRT